MLIVLFGANAEVGKWSRNYFQEHGMEFIRKKYYIPEDFPLVQRYKKRENSPKEEVLQCDFVYDRKGMLVGFNKDQLIDAVRGRKRCVLTVSGSTIDFIRQIKAAYGGYVTGVCIYTDDYTMRHVFESLPGATEAEVAARMEVGQEIKTIILENRTLFDHIVIYGGEESVFNLQSLKVQYDSILEKADRTENEMNDRMYVEMPYTGSEDYVFVSYSHKDTQQVFPIMRKLQLAGFRIWYDEGISGGENWRKILASKIESERCKDFLLFSSENSVNSRHVRAEINLALDRDKKITPVRLDDARFGSEVEMYLSTYQYLAISDQEGFSNSLIHSLDQDARIRS